MTETRVPGPSSCEQCLNCVSYMVEINYTGPQVGYLCEETGDYLGATPPSSLPGGCPLLKDIDDEDAGV